VPALGALRQNFDYARSFASFPRAVRRFVASPIDVEGARAICVDHLARRGERLLEMVEGSVFAPPHSPYGTMFDRAGLDVATLRAWVARDGVETALRELREAGVFVSYEELKGRKPIVRRGEVVPTGPRDFDTPGARGHLQLTTSGSTGLANAVYQDLDHIAELAASELPVLAAYGVATAPTVHWTHILPGSGIRYVLTRARQGQLRHVWFTPMGWRESQHWRKYGAATRYMVAAMRRAGIEVEAPIHAPPADAIQVARAVRAALDREGRCLLRTIVSLGVRVCEAALGAGFRLDGAVVRLASEPLTALRRERIEASGATVLAGYGSIETGPVGLGCANPARADEVHVLDASFVLVDRPLELPGQDVTVPSLLLTSLNPRAPKVLLNYEIDDYGTLSRRDCGCPLAALGFATHLDSIRSYSKLVGEGVTLVGSDLLPILEEELPRRFGGGPLDYQLQERADASGLTRLVLAVSPRIAGVDEREMAAFVLDRLRAASPMGDAAASVWRGAETLRIERREPEPGARGKLLPLWRERPGTSPRV